MLLQMALRRMNDVGWDLEMFHKYNAPVYVLWAIRDLGFALDWFRRHWEETGELA